mmetsp:Transcript_34541/g.98224  ORF Transcript_34541/g.98224 Transcript_34541/m.98224 type:complete len:220 (+) Transcript_34541:439-1098(+)
MAWRPRRRTWSRRRRAWSGSGASRTTTRTGSASARSSWTRSWRRVRIPSSAPCCTWVAGTRPCRSCCTGRGIGRPCTSTSCRRSSPRCGSATPRRSGRAWSSPCGTSWRRRRSAAARLRRCTASPRSSTRPGFGTGCRTRRASSCRNCSRGCATRCSTARRRASTSSSRSSRPWRCPRPSPRPAPNSSSRPPCPSAPRAWRGPTCSSRCSAAPRPVHAM